jgi:hypothetical protein
MRNLLNQGDGLFWKRVNGRIWLTSLPKLLLKLNISRLNQNSVTIPLDIWTAKIGTLRAHLYASFHSSRAGKQDDTPAAPIARATIEAITSVSPRIQRLYEQSARVKQKTNYCVGAAYSEQQFKESAWQHGRAAFQLKDVLGKQGDAGQSYIAWQLPNSYTGPHQTHEKHQRKRMNRRLVDLLDKGIAGNGRSQEFASDSSKFERRYFANGRLAAKIISRAEQPAVYWPQPKKRRTCQLWHQMS